MTPPAAAAAARTRTQVRRAPAPRRVSGRVGGRAVAAGVTAPPPLALRLGGAVHGIAEHRLLDRLVRGRAWIGILAFALMGIVFMQVSMLRMNAGIGRSVDRATVLERQNAGLRAAVSQLSSGDRIAAEAARLGFTMPAAGTTRFLDARRFDVRRALSGITPPGEMPALPETTTTTPQAPPALGTATPGTAVPGTSTPGTSGPSGAGTAGYGQTAATGTAAPAAETQTAPPAQGQTPSHVDAPAQATPTAAAVAAGQQPTGPATGGATAGASG